MKKTGLSIGNRVLDEMTQLCSVGLKASFIRMGHNTINEAIGEYESYSDLRLARYELGTTFVFMGLPVILSTDAPDILQVMP